MTLILDDVAKSFGRTPVLKGVSLEAREGEFLALLGPSGSGKTTLLRILAGLDRPERGTVRFQGEDLLRLSPRERRAGLVFQHYALFRHMTVAKNIAFGLDVRPARERPGRVEIARRVEELLDLVQLPGLGGRYPAQLSGGQRQRVALARALAIEPRILLLDEPFGALDARVRRDLRRWLRQIHDQTGVTTVFVTHDQEEALDLADRVAILKDGVLVQVGAPADLYSRPASAFVHDFLGPSFQLRASRNGQGLEAADWGFSAPSDASPTADTLCLRPADLILDPAEGLRAEVRGVASRHDQVRLTLSVGGEWLELDRAPSDALSRAAVGDIVRLRPTRFHFLPA